MKFIVRVVLSLVWLLTNFANAAATLVWNPSIPSPEGYKVYYSSLPDVSLQSTNVGAATSVSLGFLTSGRTYLLYVTAFNSAGLESDPSATVSFTPVTAPSPPSITAQPVSQSVVLGGAFTLNVAATGSSPFSYQWQKNGTNIPGATSTNYSISSAQTTDAASYAVRVSNAAGSVISSVATITVLSPPTIIAQPVSQAVDLGAAVTLSVTATGSGPLGYQWQKNGANIPGATSANHSISSAQASDAASYTVRVSNVAGTVSSSAATITILSGGPPVIARQPGSLTVEVGSTAIFSVEATGTTPLSYQWFRDAAPISGATLAAFSIPAVILSDAGNYSVGISSSGGFTMSDVAVLAVSGAPVITSEPQDTNAPVGSTVSLSVDVNGADPMTFLWSKNGTPLSGRTNRVLNITSVKSSDNGSYAVLISNGAGQVTSRAANVKIYSAPKITRPPKPRSVSAGSQLVLSVEAESEVPLSYSWLREGNYIPGATNSTFEVSVVSERDSGSYSVEISNPAGSVVSDVAVVLVGTGSEEITLRIAISKTDFNVLELTLSGEPATYELQQTTALNGPWKSVLRTNISSPTEILVPMAAGHFGLFRVVRLQD